MNESRRMNISGSVLKLAVAEHVAAVDGLVSSGITHYRGAANCLYSVYPPTAYLGFGNWIYQVPPFRPENILMLGYAGGTVAGLIRLLYGDVAITAVDQNIIDNRYGVDLVQ